MSVGASGSGVGGSSAPDLDSYRQQLEEAVALQAIYEDDFRVYKVCADSSRQAGSFVEDNDLDPEAVLADLDGPGTSDRQQAVASLAFEILVQVELPAGGLQLLLPAPSPGPALAEYAGVPAEAGLGGTIAAGEPVPYLTPLRLVLALPPAYPAVAPALQLSATWLSKAHAQSLAQCLLAECDSTGPVCYSWVEWLKVNTLPHINATSALVIPTDPSASGCKACGEAGGADGGSGGSGAGLRRGSARGSPQSRQRIDPGTSTSGATSNASLSQSQSGPSAPGASPGPSDASSAAAAAAAVPVASVGIQSWSHVPRPEETALNLMRYAANRSMQAFRQEVWLCAICFDDVAGTRCERLPGCHHVFCTSCLSMHCRTLALEGAVERVACPDPTCRLQLPPHLVRELLSEEEFERWETLLLRKALDRMKDVVYCPRCQGICIDDKDNMAQCPGCLYVFCSRCYISWHPTEPCLDPEQALELRRAAEANTAQPEAVRRRREVDLMNQMKSLSVVRNTSKQCPGCGMAIDKFDGCNKVTCSCGTLFCWKCFQIVDGYDHFSAVTCTLFDDIDVQRWRDREAGAGVVQPVVPARQPRPRAGEPVVRRPACPLCGQWNIKVDGNNNIRCWSCGNNFCGLCRIVLRRGKAGQHFSPSGCKQHTFD